MTSDPAAHTRRLSELTAADAGRFGGKSAGLGELLGAGIPVPPGFALSTSAFSGFVDEAGLGEAIDAALSDAGAGEVTATAQAARVIGETIRSAPVPDALRTEIEGRYAEVQAVAGTGSPPMAVRSSALGEDSSEATFAGQQETYLWVRGAGDICDAVRDCWASLYSTEAISYRARLGAADRPAMGVTVQLMVDSTVSGVMFTCNPVSGDRSMVAINASWGLGVAVVGGEVTPDDYLVSKITREIVRRTVGDKQLEYVPAASGHGTTLVEIDAERRGVPCLDDAAVAALVDLGRRVERHFGGHQDIEWAIARGQAPPEGLFVLQSRPVTGLPDRTEPAAAPASAMAMVMGTFGAVPRQDR
jgi:pyruvate,water dikinase